MESVAFCPSKEISDVNNGLSKHYAFRRVGSRVGLPLGFDLALAQFSETFKVEDNMDLGGPPGTDPMATMPSQPRGPPTPVNSAEKKLVSRVLSLHAYVGNLDPRVTESMLYQIFTLGVANDIIQSVKILQQHENKNYPNVALNYGFVEFRDHAHADQALQTLNGKKIFSSEIRVNWAFNSSNATKEDLTSHFHIFVGDLSPEVTDQVLAKAFSVFGSMSDARVMWDPNTGKSRGYGFVAFRDKGDAESAINTMNSEWARFQAGTTLADKGQRYETVVAQTPPYNTTIYVGNITPTTTQNELVPLFSQFGFIVEVRMQADKGYAFVKLDTHENAALAIVSLNSVAVQGRQLRCSWGKDRAPEGAGYQIQNYGYQQQPIPWFFPQGLSE
ncbi:hypothetical protein HK101_003569 [Irineochytrium annulatum]|nr:hypothetical protein HK101_003569 [Irineochytrium annulatum]